MLIGKGCGKNPVAWEKQQKRTRRINSGKGAMILEWANIWHNGIVTEQWVERY
jgi:hypothetical protein